MKKIIFIFLVFNTVIYSKNQKFSFEYMIIKSLKNTKKNVIQWKSNLWMHVINNPRIIFTSIAIILGLTLLYKHNKYSKRHQASDNIILLSQDDINFLLNNKIYYEEFLEDEAAKTTTILKNMNNLYTPIQFQLSDKEENTIKALQEILLGMACINDLVQEVKAIHKKNNQILKYTLPTFKLYFNIIKNIQNKIKILIDKNKENNKKLISLINMIKENFYDCNYFNVNEAIKLPHQSDISKLKQNFPINFIKKNKINQYTKNFYDNYIMFGPNDNYINNINTIIKKEKEKEIPMIDLITFIKNNVEDWIANIPVQKNITYILNQPLDPMYFQRQRIIESTKTVILLSEII